MKKEEMLELSKKIQEKLGEESSALIMDDLGILITDNENVNNMIASRDVEIEKQKSLNESLIRTNSSLLQQVGTQGSSVLNKREKEEPEEPKRKSFSIKDCFDSKGNFIK